MAVNDKMSKVVNNIIKSAEDARQYRGLELKNGLKVLLVSDPTTDKSSAALDVHIGHMSDPEELPGLAHFCEHMLFLGTTKYPEENEYSKFLSEHAGSSNAFTSAEHTNYYFDVAPEYLPQALDRFAQFFTCPLFTEGATGREVNAVSSENDKNLQNDSWRLHQLEHATCNPKHAYSKFGTGNKETLETTPKQNGLNVRDELLKFHSRYYSSNLMALCVLGKESLDELTDLVLPLFLGVENKSVSVPEWNDHPCGPAELETTCVVAPIKDIRGLNILWPLPDLQPFYKVNPGHYISHLIGHEGPGSLLSELKNKGWVNTLVSGAQQGAKGFMNFSLNVDLTEEGICHVDDIMTLIYQYLNMLRMEGPKEWIFRECQNLSAMSFRFKDKERPSSYTCHCSAALHDFPMSEVLCGDYIYDEYKPELMQMVLDKLAPEFTRSFIVGKVYEGKTDLTERWYGTQYSICKLPQDVIQKWKDVGLSDKFRLPDVNEFIPINFDIVPRDTETSPVPTILRDSKLTRLWYRQDDKFNLPKACVSVQLTSPFVYMDPLSANMTHLFSTLLKDALNEYTYAAELAGLGYDLYSTTYGLVLTVGGYTDKEHVLLQKIMDKITTFEIDPQRFAILLENMVRNLKNFRAEQPHQHAIYYTNMLTAEQLWTKEELLEATEDMSLEKLEAFIPRIFSQASLETLVYGNVTKERSMELSDIVENSLIEKYKTRPLLPSQQRRFREVQLPDGSCYIYRKQNDVHKSSSLEVYYQCNMQETYSNMVLELFCQIISEPCFDILRTQEQLGYIVFSGVRRTNGVQGLRVIVQSDKTPEYVEARIEAFLYKMQTYIVDMAPEVFDKHISALAVKRLETPKKLSSQNMKYWSEITIQQYNFDRDEIEVRQLKSLTKDDILNFYKELIAYNAPKRHKLSVHVVSSVTGLTAESDTALVTEDVPAPEDGPDGIGALLCAKDKLSEIDDVISFKRELGLFPLPKPFISLNPTNMSKL